MATQEDKEREVKKGLGKIFYYELKGRREAKFHFLERKKWGEIQWKELQTRGEEYFFIPKDWEREEEYQKGFSINEIFLTGHTGLSTEWDQFLVKRTKEEAEKLLKDLKELKIDRILEKYALRKSKKERLERMKKDLEQHEGHIIPINYRLFDRRFVIYTGHSKGVMGRPRGQLTEQMLQDNIALLICRRHHGEEFRHVHLTKIMADRSILSLKSGEITYIYPLFLYEKIDQKEKKLEKKRKTNLNEEIIATFEEILGTSFQERATETDNAILGAFQIFDYIYGTLHSPFYRRRYRDFFKIDFPKIPYPPDENSFWQKVHYGRLLRKLHVFKNCQLEEAIAAFPQKGSNRVDRKKGKYWQQNSKHLERGNIWINEEQYFQDVPNIAWNFYIGSYQPAQKWLAERHGRKLTDEEIEHYRKIICVLMKTAQTMKEIEKIDGRENDEKTLSHLLDRKEKTDS